MNLGKQTWVPFLRSAEATNRSINGTSRCGGSWHFSGLRISRQSGPPGASLRHAQRERPIPIHDVLKASFGAWRRFRTL